MLFFFGMGILLQAIFPQKMARLINCNFFCIRLDFLPHSCALVLRAAPEWIGAKCAALPSANGNFCSILLSIFAE
jgi:hypothetical protein